MGFILRREQADAVFSKVRSFWHGGSGRCIQSELNLVAHYVRDVGFAGSNPVTSTKDAASLDRAAPGT
jgi:hypothetical protein